MEFPAFPRTLRVKDRREIDRMDDKRRFALFLLFLLAVAVFNWPIAGIFLESPLYGAFAGLFAAMGVFVAALYAFSGGPGASDGPDDSEDPCEPASGLKKQAAPPGPGD